MGLIILVSHGSDGDVLPFIGLGRTLRERGHEVTLLTHAPYGPAARNAGLAFGGIDTAEEYERAQASTETLLTGRASPSVWLDFYERHDLFDQAMTEFAAIESRHVPGETVLVGRHTSAISVPMASMALGVPAVSVAVAPAQLMTARMTRYLYANVLRDGMDMARVRAGLSPVLDWDALLASADLELGLWPDWFDKAGTPSRARLTGFLLADDRPRPVPPEAAELLEGPVPPVLVTAGTGRLTHPRFHEAAIEACRLAGLPTLLVAPHGIPGPLPANVVRVAALPFAEVMPKVGVLLHHGGIGTLARALRSGTAQVVLGHGADRPDNAERLAAAGLATWLPLGSWEPHEIAELVLEARAPVPTSGFDGATGAAELIESLLPVQAGRAHR